MLRQQEPRNGRIALVTQSGALGNSLLLSLLRRGGGVGHWFSTGNELDTGALELVTGLLHREDVDAVGLFLEGVTDLDWLEPASAALRATGKAVYLLKAARTDLGRLAATGHTGRVVGSAEVSTAILAEAGFSETPSIDHLADALLCSDVIGPITGGRIGVVSVSGATAVLAADRVRCSSSLSLAEVPPALRGTGPSVDPDQSARRAIPRRDAGVRGDHYRPHRFRSRRCRRGDRVGAGSNPEELTAHLLAHRSGPPVVISYLSSDDPLDPSLLVRLADAGVAVVPTTERAVAVLDLLTHTTRPPTPEVSTTTEEMLGWEEVCSLPAAAALPLPRWQAVTSADEAEGAAADIGFPLVVKAAGRAVAHRSELGAVRVGVRRDTLRAAVTEVAAAVRDHGDMVLLQQQVDEGLEVLVACLRDPEFGPVALVRPGGVLAELLHGQVVLSARWPRERHHELLAASPVGKLLLGYRGGPRYNLDALADVVASLLALIEDGLSFVECNPVVVTAHGATIVDVQARR